MLLHKIIISVVLLAASYSGMAQKSWNSFDHPVNSTAVIHEQLFELPAQDDGYQFRVDLPTGNHLLLRFGKLSYWAEGSVLNIVTAANAAWKQAQDSFSYGTSTRRLSVNIPGDSRPVVLSIREYGHEGRVAFVSDKKLVPARVAMDTITVLQENPNPGSGALHASFLLHDLEEIDGLANDLMLLANISAKLDSLVAAKRKEWKQQDAAMHRLQAWYDVREGAGGVTHLQTRRPAPMMKTVDFNADLGASFIAGAISSYATARISYQWGSGNSNIVKFAGLSYSAISFVKEQNGRLSLRNLGFVNVETGTRFLESDTRIPLYRSSIGVGYRVQSKDVGVYNFRYRAFINFSFTPAVTMTPEFYIIPSSGDQKTEGFLGLSLSVKLF